MTIKQDPIIFAAAAMLFGFGCVIMLIADEALSRYPVFLYVFMAIWGVSALLAPIYFIRATRDTVRVAIEKQKSR